MFGETYRSGRKAPASGIYRCTGCGRKVTVNRGKRLPACHGDWEIFERTTKKSKKQKGGFFDSLFA